MDTPELAVEVVEAHNRAVDEEAVAAACVLCGKSPADGFAMIDGRRYCHADLHQGWPSPTTCYMRATFDAGFLRQNSPLMRMLAAERRRNGVA